MRAPASSRAEAGAAVAGDGLPYVDECLAADLLDVGDLLGRLVGLVGEHAAGELALERDQRERVAEQVVQVAGEAQPLLVGGELGDGGARLAQFDGRTDELPHARHREPAEQRRDTSEAEASRRRPAGTRSATIAPVTATIAQPGQYRSGSAAPHATDTYTNSTSQGEPSVSESIERRRPRASAPSDRGQPPRGARRGPVCRKTRAR